MTGAPNGGFGRRGTTPRPAAPAGRASPHTVYREGEAKRPAFHDLHIERHWPKYGAAAFALFALGYSLYDGKRDPLGLVLVPLFAAFWSYLGLAGSRKAINHLHTVRTQTTTRSPAFFVGVMLGFAYFVYSTFISPQTILARSGVCRRLSETDSSARTSAWSQSFFSRPPE